MSEVKVQVGDTIPQGTFTYIPYTPELEDHSACGIRTYHLSRAARDLSDLSN